jgi:hypothetical protein
MLALMMSASGVCWDVLGRLLLAGVGAQLLHAH